MADILDETLLPRKGEWVNALNGRLVRLQGIVTPSKRTGGNPVVRYRVVAVEQQPSTTMYSTAPSYVEVECLTGELWDYELTGELKDGSVPTGAVYERARACRAQALAERVSVREYVSRMENAIGVVKAVKYNFTAITRDGKAYASVSLMLTEL